MYRSVPGARNERTEISQQITHLDELAVHVKTTFAEWGQRHRHTANSTRKVTLDR